MKDFMIGFGFVVFIGACVLAAVHYSIETPQEIQQRACRSAAREESALTACKNAGNCLSTTEQWRDFESDVRECMGRIK